MQVQNKLKYEISRRRHGAKEQGSGIQADCVWRQVDDRDEEE